MLLDKNNKNLLWVLPTLGLLILFTLGPLISIFTDAFSGPGGNFSKAFEDQTFKRSIINTALLTTLLPFGVLLISIPTSLGIAAITNRFFLRKSIVIATFIQYVMVGSAVATGFTILFTSQGGFLNWIIEMVGGEPIGWLTSKNSMWTVLMISIIGQLPFQITVLSSSFISTDKKYTKLYKVEMIDKWGWKRDKNLIKENFKTLNILFIILLMTGFTIHPVQMFSGDLDALFAAESQTMISYITRQISFSNQEIASSASLITMLFSVVPVGMAFATRYGVGWAFNE